MNKEKRQAMAVRVEAIRSHAPQRTLNEGWLEDEVTGELVDPNYSQAFDEAADIVNGFGDLADKTIGYVTRHNDLDEAMGTFGKLISRLEGDGISDEAHSLIMSSFTAASKGWRSQAERYREHG